MAHLGIEMYLDARCYCHLFRERLQFHTVHRVYCARIRERYDLPMAGNSKKEGGW